MIASKTPDEPRLKRVFTSLSLIAFGVALFDLFTDGASFNLGPLRLSTRQAFRPLMIAVLSGTAAIWLSDRRSLAVVNWDRIPRRSPWLAAAAALMTVAIGIRFGDFAAGGSDAYGYVSQASLWAAGAIVAPEPLAPLAPLLGESIAPLGYKFAVNHGGLVPIYAPGLPLLMAVALRIGGSSAVYLVVPLLGALTVWLTYWLGARVTGSCAGLAAAGLTACSPIFLAQLTQPMSDVPVTAWWLAALAFATRQGPWMALSAGFAASAAVLTRPNLVPLALVVALLVSHSRPRFGRGLLFSLGLVPGVVAIAMLNQALYGSPFTSGYGSFNTIYEWNRLGINLRRYAWWLFQLHSAFIYLALVAPVAAFWSVDRGVPDHAASGRGASTTAMTCLLLAFGGVLLLCYLFYVPFDTWQFLRFLLPGIPLLLILSAYVVLSLITILAPARRRAAIAFAFFGLMGCWYVKKADDLGILASPAFENRYITVGQYVGRALPEHAVVITMIESGSVRLYGHRSTVRWDVLPGNDIDRAVAVLEMSGYVPYILLEDWEEPEFRERFAKSSVFGRIDWPPAMEYGDGEPYIRIWALSDRGRSLAGLPVITERVPKRVRT